MNDLKVFQNENFGQVRTIDESGKILFCGSDVAKALGYAKPNDAVNTHCRATVKRSTPISGKIQEINFITEGDLYRLITNSKLPTAEKFESWVFDEVLPDIRKHGTYMTDSKLEEVLLNPDTIIQLATQLKEERTLRGILQERTAKQEQIIGELKPKADYVDSILNNKGLVTITQIAKDYGMSAQQTNDILHDLKIQFKQSEQWLLYRRYHNKGYTHSETINIKRSDGRPDIKMNTKWTQKGRIFIYQLLKENGHFPVIEQQQAS